MVLLKREFNHLQNFFFRYKALLDFFSFSSRFPGKLAIVSTLLLSLQIFLPRDAALKQESVFGLPARWRQCLIVCLGRNVVVGLHRPMVRQIVLEAPRRHMVHVLRQISKCFRRYVHRLLTFIVSETHSLSFWVQTISHISHIE